MKHQVLGVYVWWFPRVVFLSLLCVMVVVVFRNSVHSPYDEGFREDAAHQMYLQTFIEAGILLPEEGRVVADDVQFYRWFEENSSLGTKVAYVRQHLGALMQNNPDEKQLRSLIKKGIVQDGKINEERYHYLVSQYPSAHYYQQAKQHIERFKVKDGVIQWDAWYLRETNRFHLDPMIPKGTVYDRSMRPLARWEEGKYVQDQQGNGLVHLLLGNEGLLHHLDADLSGKPDRGIHDLIGLKGHHQRGDDIQLTLNQDVCQKIYDLFQEKQAYGSAMIIDVQSGEIIAAVSVHEPETEPLQPWEDLYFPGSTYKTVVAATQLQYPHVKHEKLNLMSDPNRKVKDILQFQKVRNHRGLTSPVGMDLELALARSSNTYFARQAIVLGQRVNEVAQDLGFEQNVNLLWQLPSAKPWYSVAPTTGRETPFIPGNYGLYAQYGIGQNAVKTHPLQMASMMQIIANEGRYRAPTLVLAKREGMREDEEVQHHEFQRLGGEQFSTVLTERQARRLQKALAGTMNMRNGTGYRAPQLYRIGREYKAIKRANAPRQAVLIPMAGKTGTAQDGNRKPHAWFAGFAPAKQPRYAIAVVVKNIGLGSQHAIPIATEALAECFRQTDQEEYQSLTQLLSPDAFEPQRIE